MGHHRARAGETRQQFCPVLRSAKRLRPSCRVVLSALGNETSTAEERFRIDGEDGRWLLRSVVNKFSVLSPTGETQSGSRPGPGEASVNGVGLDEVLIESPRHDLSMAVFPVAHVQRILETYRHRFLEFYGDTRVRHVIVFKNHGSDAGASQQHPHSQIVGLPIVPGQVVERIERARRFFVESGQCLACAQISQEREQASRIIAESAGFVAFIPYAALSPYHLWIFPKAHVACFSEQSIDTLPELAEILSIVLAKVHGMLGNPAFNFVIRSLGPQEKDAPHFHWYISIVPRVNKPAGLEDSRSLKFSSLTAFPLRDARVTAWVQAPTLRFNFLDAGCLAQTVNVPITERTKSLLMMVDGFASDLAVGRRAAASERASSSSLLAASEPKVVGSRRSRRFLQSIPPRDRGERCWRESRSYCVRVERSVRSCFVPSALLKKGPPNGIGRSGPP